MKQSLRMRWLVLAVMSLLGNHLFAQSVTLTQTPNASACTGDSLNINLTVISTYPGSNSFDVEMTPGNAATADFTDPATLNVPIAKWVPNGGPIPAADTNNAGSKILTIIVPETITVNGTYSIRLVGSNPAGPSTNVFEVAVNVTITAEIDTSFVKGAFKNIYTPGNPDDWGKCVDDTVVLYANPGFNYQWMVNGVDVRLAQPGRTDDRFDSLLVWLPGTYTVEVSSGPVCPGTSDPIVINNYIPTPVMTIQPIPLQPWVEELDFPLSPSLDSVQFCETDSVLIFGERPQIPGEFYTYRWLKDTVNQNGLDTVVAIAGATNDTIYITDDLMATSTMPNYMEIYLEVTDTMTGCVTLGTDPKWVWMDTVPDTEISAITWGTGQPGASTILCVEDSVRLRADTIGGPDWEYQWQARFPLNGGTWASLPNDTLPTLQVDTALIPDSAEYRLVINNLTCSWITQPIQVNIVPNPVFQFLPSDSVAICAGDSVLVAVTGNGVQYDWSNGFIGTSQYLSTPGQYWVRATGVNQCVTYDTLILFPLVVNANAGPDQTVGPDEDVVMDASGGVSYYWYADEPAYFSNRRDPNTLTRPIKDTTVYYVEVTAANGCVGIDSMIVYIESPFAGGPDLSNVQNVMTPNGDGANDDLDLREVIQGDACELVVMNRWGATVYTEEDYINGWTGVTNGGDLLPDGTYYFLLSCDDEIRYQGAITIIRNND